MKILTDAFAVIAGVFIFILAIAINVLMLAIPVFVGVWLARYFGVI